MSTLPGLQWCTLTAAGQPVPASKVKDPGPKKRGLANTLEQTLHLYAQLPESQRKPAQPITDANRPTQAPPPGGVVLTVYDRFLQRDYWANYRAIVGNHSPQQPLTVPGPQRNSLWLTQAECRLLMPENPQKGQTMPVPAHLVRRIALFGLMPASAWHAGYEWKADSLRGGSLALTIEEVSDTRVRMRLQGSALLASKIVLIYGTDRPYLPEGLNNRYDARLEGTIVYDPARKQILRWDMTALGDYLGICYAYDHPKPFATKPLALGFAFELDSGSYELPAEFRRNKPAALTYVPERYYFDPEKWEADGKNNQKK